MVVAALARAEAALPAQALLLEGRGFRFGPDEVAASPAPWVLPKV